MATAAPQQEQQQQQQPHRGRRISEEITSLLRLKESRRLNPAPYYTPRKASQSQSLGDCTFKQYNEYANEKDSSMPQRNRALAAKLNKLTHDFWENDCVIDEDIFEDSSDEEEH